MNHRSRILLSLLLVIAWTGAHSAPLQIHPREYFETQGLNVLVYSNRYDGLFSDAKMSGIEIIHHGVRTATNGDVRLQSTPEQWDPVPEFVDRDVDRESGTIRTRLEDNGLVTVGYGGGCLWAGDPNMDGELEALVVGASVTFTTGFSGARL